MFRFHERLGTGQLVLTDYLISVSSNSTYGLFGMHTPPLSVWLHRVGELIMAVIFQQNTWNFDLQHPSCRASEKASVRSLTYTGGVVTESEELGWKFCKGYMDMGQGNTSDFIFKTQLCHESVFDNHCIIPCQFLPSLCMSQIVF